jgi:hypothetical protein
VDKVKSRAMSPVHVANPKAAGGSDHRPLRLPACSQRPS